MANKSLRCLRADGGMHTKNKKTTAEILIVMGRYELMDLLRAKRGGELNQVRPDTTPPAYANMIIYESNCVSMCVFLNRCRC
jgi:hypothetical protein